MLRQLRSAEKMKRILWIGLLVLIIPSMVAFYGFGTGDMGTSRRNTGHAAKINYVAGSEGSIGATELRFARNYLENRLMRYSQDQGVMLDNLAVSELSDSRSLLDQAVNLDILRNYAEVNGLDVSIEEVSRTFQESTTADQRRQFVEQLRAQGQRLDTVLEEERKGRVLQKAADAIGEQVRITHFEAWQDFANQKETIVADFIKFNPTDYLTSVSITEDGLVKYFEENKEKFRVADQVTYDYVLLRKDDLKSSLTVTNDEITSYYNANMDEFKLPRKVEASQIFLKVPTADDLNTTSPEAITSATLEITKQANDLYERAAKGEDFASLADTYSQEDNFPPRADMGTTASEGHTTAGGNLGLLSEEVAQTWYGDQWTSAVFALEAGGITRPIRTPQGFAVVQTRNILEGEIQPLDQVRPVVENKIRDEKAEPLFEQAGERMQQVASNVTGNLQAIAAQTSTTVATTAKVNEGERFIPGIGLLGDFQTLISDLEKGVPSDVLSDTQRHMIIQVKEEFPSHLPELTDARPRVEQAYKLQLAEDKAREKAEELLTKATDLASFQQAVLDANTTLTHSRPFTRPEVSTVFGGPVTDFETKSAGLKKGTIQITEVGRPEQQRSFVVWHANQITEPSRTDFTTDLTNIMDRLTERKREIMVLEYIRDQRQKLEGRIGLDESYL